MQNISMQRDQLKVAVLITCHNRREKTLACLAALFANALPDGTTLHVILVDDGSTDGTEAAVRERYPSVEIIKGDGNLFWNRGMHIAFARAMEVGFDAYLWLNDDTILYPSAITTMLSVWEQTKIESGTDSIIVGSTQDPDTGRHTYGGVVRHSALKRFRYSLVQPGQQPIECHTMNGNCVLVPETAARRIGNLEPNFAHAMGDTDYGLRAGKAGIKVFVAPGYVGECSRNSAAGSFNDLSLAAAQRWKKILSVKGLPPKSWWIFTRRHGGLLAPVYWAWPYVRVWLR